MSDLRCVRPLWFEPSNAVQLARNESSSIGSHTSLASSAREVTVTKTGKQDREEAVPLLQRCSVSTEEPRSTRRPHSARSAQRKEWEEAYTQPLALEVNEKKLVDLCTRKLELEQIICRMPDIDAEHQELTAALQAERRERQESERRLAAELSQIDAAESRLRSRLEAARQAAAKRGIRYDSDNQEFKIADRVECRKLGENWEVGIVTSLSPLRVRPDGWKAAYQWHQVRRIAEVASSGSLSADGDSRSDEGGGDAQQWATAEFGTTSESGGVAQRLATADFGTPSAPGMVDSLREGRFDEPKGTREGLLSKLQSSQRSPEQSLDEPPWDEFIHYEIEQLRANLSGGLKELGDAHCPGLGKSRCERQVASDSLVVDLARSLGTNLSNRRLELELMKEHQAFTLLHMERLNMEAADMESQAAVVHGRLQRRRRINRRLWSYCKKLQDAIRSVAVRSVSLDGIAADENAPDSLTTEAKPITAKGTLSTQETSPRQPSKHVEPPSKSLEKAACNTQVIQSWQEFASLLFERERRKIQKGIAKERARLEGYIEDRRLTEDTEWENLREKVAVASRFVPQFRKFQELLRQRCERWQEVQGLSSRLNDLGQPFFKALRECPAMQTERELRHVDINSAPLADLDRSMWSLTSCLWAIDAYTRREITGLHEQGVTSQKRHTQVSRKGLAPRSVEQKKRGCKNAQPFL